MKAKWLALLFVLPFALFFIAFQLAPLAWVAVSSFYSDTYEAWGFGNYQDILTSAFYLQAMKFSLDISIWSSVYGLLIALVGSYSLRQLGPTKLHDFVMSFTNMTSNFAGVPLAFAFVILLGLNGTLTLIMRKYGLMSTFNLYSKDGLIVLYTYFQIPLGVLLLYPAFDGLRDDWRESAALLGAGRWRFWRYIGLPVLAPALMGTFVILLANALGAYATVYALTTGNFNVVPVRIAALVSGDISLDPNMGSALAMLLVVLMAFITLIHQWLLRRSYLNVR
ncbi:MAG: ABC transporter permease subunit [Rouxiella aceris]|jgi:putative spermidine/putrescine transport system permease protein|uniref:ABC transporter permease subunit n=1 Tax=Rouxiella aceris TaxID=2703884 RepID=A0A848MJ52_9GAMM|nr:ABC transporter permease subunit [Rouxiella aceris]MDR3430308.1 ABC transporter permease subunit [Rouxiella aceris]NMP28488.1 ABC transporter permease subunit [Rouxiella aceris]